MLNIFNLLLLIHYCILSVASENTNSTHFTDISIFDSFTRTTNCTSLDHLFIINTEVYLSKVNSDDIFFTVPDSFTNFSSVPSIIYDSDNIKLANVFQVGTSNTFGLQFTNTNNRDAVISFEFFAKLDNSAQSLISSPQSITYQFNTTTGDKFNNTINFTGISLFEMTTNGGVFANNKTAWFTADLPIKLLNSAVTFRASAKDFEFDLKKTKVQVIGSVDEFGNPLKLVPFTAFTDKSTSDKIQIFIDTNISGGKYVRISYFSEKIEKLSIDTDVSLTKDKGYVKRDSSDSNVISSSSITLYAPSDADDNDNVSSLSESSSFISTFRPIYSNSTYTKPTASISKDQIISVRYVTDGKTTLDIVTATQAPILTHMVSYIPISTLSSTSIVSVNLNVSSTITSSSMQRKSKSIVTLHTSSMKPSAIAISNDTNPSTISSSYSVHNTTKLSTISSSHTIKNNTKPSIITTMHTKINGEVVTSTLGPQLFIETNLVAMQTIRNKTTSIVTSSSSNSTTTETLNNKFSFTKINGEIITLTQSAQLSVMTNLVALGKVKNDTSSVFTTSKTKLISVTSTSAIQHSTTKLNNTISDAISKSRTTNSTKTLTSVFAKTQPAIKTMITSLVPVGVLKNTTSTLISCEKVTKSLNGIEIVETSINAIGRLKNSTTSKTQTTVLVHTKPAVKTTELSLIPLTTIKSNKTTIVSQSTATNIQTSVLIKTQPCAESIDVSLIPITTIRNATTTICPSTSLNTPLPVETKPVQTTTIPLSSNATKKHVISTSKTPKTITAKISSSLAAQVTTNTEIIAISSIQTSSSVALIQTYEAAAHKISWTFTNCIFFAIALFL